MIIIIFYSVKLFTMLIIVIFLELFVQKSQTCLASSNLTAIVKVYTYVLHSAGSCNPTIRNNLPCQNGGTCQSFGTNGFLCSCPFDFVGALCQTCKLFVCIAIFFFEQSVYWVKRIQASFKQNTLSLKLLNILFEIFR